MNGAKHNLLLVGWDGATFDVIRPMVARGELPNLARLMAEGAHGPLRSTVPPSSAVAWTTCMTGRDPVGHGIFGFHQPAGHSYRRRLVNSHDVRGPRLWDWLGQSGYQVGVVNVPLTYPPRPVHGFMVSGMLTPGPEETFTYPPDLTTELLIGTRPYPIETQVMKQIYASLQSPARLLERIHRWTDDFHTTTHHLLANHPCDCFIVVYRTTDTVQHALGFLRHPELAARHPELLAEADGGIEAIYRQVDTCLGELLALVPPETTVMIVSDHGAGPSFGRFCINNWLRRLGHLVLKPGARYRHWLGHRNVPLRRVLNRLRLGALARRMPAWLTDRPIPLPDKRQLDHLVDWHRTRAYVPFSGVQCAVIRLNLAGRESSGIVQPGPEAETLLAELARQLAEVRDRQGNPLFQEVEVIANQSIDLITNQGPDLVALPREENYHAIFPTITDDGQILIGPRLRAAGQHRMDGTLVVHGPAIAPGVTSQGARLADITPTALHLMELPVPAEMDGRVLTEILRPDWLTVHPVQTASEGALAYPTEQADVFSAEETTQVEDVLRALGYLD